MIGELGRRRLRTSLTIIGIAIGSSIKRTSVDRREVSALEGGGIGLIAADPSLPETLGVGLWSGTLLNAADAAHPVAVVGAAAARHLGIDRADGCQVWIDDRPYVVIGVLEPIALIADLDRSVLVGWGKPTPIWASTASDVDSTPPGGRPSAGRPVPSQPVPPTTP